MLLGAQLYTVRMYTQTISDFEDTIKEIASIGYQSVQLSAIGAEITPQIARDICDQNKISIVITHNDANRILHDTEQLIEDHKVMNCNYIGLGSMPEKYRNPEWFPHFAKDYKEAARKIKEAGMLLMYHNHDFEFEKINGKYYLDMLMDEFAPDELGFTLDTYWLQAAGADVLQWIEKCKDRIPCVHLKDMAMVNRKAVMAPVLEGNMNFPSILKQLEKTSCKHILVEQDICGESPFVCLKKSYNNLVSLGY